MNEICELSKSDWDILRHAFPNHRFEDVGRKTPWWVRNACKNMRIKLVESCMMLPYAVSGIIGLVAGSEYKIIRNGTLICLSSKDGCVRVALLLEEERA